MDPHRRHLLQGAASAGGFGLALAAGLVPGPARAAWPQKAFEEHDEKKAMQLLAEGGAVTMAHVTVTAPQLAENGAVVPVSIESDLPNVVAMSLFAEDNPFPLNSQYELRPGALPYLSTRLRLAKSQNVMGVVKTADGKLYGGKALVKVTIGGCGG
jgi:sulfur-oxidizing protein SoxY